MFLEWSKSILETTDVDDIRLPDWSITIFEGESYEHEEEDDGDAISMFKTFLLTLMDNICQG